MKDVTESRVTAKKGKCIVDTAKGSYFDVSCHGWGGGGYFNIRNTRSCSQMKVKVMLLFLAPSAGITEVAKR